MVKFCSLYSGSSGNSIYLGTERTKLLIDAGVSGDENCRRAREISVRPEQIDGILITHEHSDHVKGVGIFSRKFDVPVYAREKTWAAMRQEIGPIKEENVRIIDRRDILRLETSTSAIIRFRTMPRIRLHTRFISIIAKYPWRRMWAALRKRFTKTSWKVILRSSSRTTM